MTKPGRIRWTSGERDALVRSLHRRTAEHLGLRVAEVTERTLRSLKSSELRRLLTEAQHEVFSGNPERVRNCVNLNLFQWVLSHIPGEASTENLEFPDSGLLVPTDGNSKELSEPPTVCYSAEEICAQDIFAAVYPTLVEYVERNRLHTDEALSDTAKKALRLFLKSSGALRKLPVVLPRGLRPQVLLIGYSSQAASALETLVGHRVDFRVYSDLTAYSLRTLINESYLVLADLYSLPRPLATLVQNLSGHKLRVVYDDLVLCRQLVEQLLPPEPV